MNLKKLSKVNKKCLINKKTNKKVNKQANNIVDKKADLK